MNYRDYTLGDWIGHISGVIEDETTLDGNEMRDLVEFLTTLREPKTDRIEYGTDEKNVFIICANSMLFEIEADRMNFCDGVVFASDKNGNIIGYFEDAKYYMLKNDTNKRVMIIDNPVATFVPPDKPFWRKR